MTKVDNRSNMGSDDDTCRFALEGTEGAGGLIELGVWEGDCPLSADI